MTSATTGIMWKLRAKVPQGALNSRKFKKATSALGCPNVALRI